MARPSKDTWRRHDEAEALLSLQRTLTYEEIEFVLENWSPVVHHNVSVAGAFFTPMQLAHDIACFNHLNYGGTYVDICAGIGRLTWPLLCRSRWDNEDVRKANRFVAVEINAEYAAVGKRLMPEVEWVVADAFDKATWDALGTFNLGMSNPPFNRVKSVGAYKWLNYQGGKADLMAAELIARYCEHGGYIILPPFSAPRYAQEVIFGSNKKYSEDNYLKWLKANPEFHMTPTSIDTSPHCAAYAFEETGTRVIVCDIERDEDYVPEVAEEPEPAVAATEALFDVQPQHRAPKPRAATTRPTVRQQTAVEVPLFAEEF